LVFALSGRKSEGQMIYKFHYVKLIIMLQ
jgi:hypothetical protein